MKKLIVCFFLGTFLFFVFSTAKNEIVRLGIKHTFHKVFDLDIEIGHLDVNFRKSYISLRDVRLYNPKGYKDRLMLKMPYLYIKCNVLNVLKAPQYIEEARIEISDLFLIRTKDKNYNLDVLKIVPDDEYVPDIHLDLFYLKLDKVFYKDYARSSSPKTIQFDLNVDETFRDIDAEGELIPFLTRKAYFAVQRFLIRSSFRELMQMGRFLKDKFFSINQSHVFD